MRCYALLLSVALLTAADPDPAAFVPADATIAVRVPDLTRSRARWNSTPYLRLLQSGWGQILIGEWGGRLNQAVPGAGAALEGIGVLALGATMSPGQPPRVVVAGAGSPLLAALADAQFPGAVSGRAVPTPGGRLTMHGVVVAWASGSGGAIQPGAPAKAPVDGEADVEIILKPPAGGNPLSGPVRVDLRLDAVGLRETATLTATPASRAAAAVVTRWADPQELRRLPATTLWAATWDADPKVSAALVDAVAADPGTAMFEKMLVDAGMPGWLETLRALDGPTTVWMAEGMPFPSLTLAMSMPPALAKRWIAGTSAALHLAATPEGADGFVGLTHIACGVLDGRLVITTDAIGLDAWRRRLPGFAEHTGVATVLAALPPRTVLLGASRGGASWAAVAQLTVPLFIALGAPQAVALPGDLKLAADRGWLYAKLPKDGAMIVESGGLFGGPFSVGLGGATATAATMWIQQELHRQKRIPAAEPAVEPVVPVPAPMF